MASFLIGLTWPDALSSSSLEGLKLKGTLESWENMLDLQMPTSILATNSLNGLEVTLETLWRRIAFH